MNRPVRWLSTALILVAIATQFQNCGNYADPASYTGMSAMSVSCDQDCITQSVDNISIKVNFGGSTEFSVPAGMAEFNLGGDCNEGGYPYNTIRWELQLNGVMVRHSGLLQADSRCINGRFLVYVNLSAIPGGDNFNRAGLMTPSGARSPYDLWIEIYGQDMPGGVPQRNTIKGRTRISLIAI